MSLPAPDALRTDAFTARLRRDEIAAYRRRIAASRGHRDTVRYVVLPAVGIAALAVGGLALAFGFAQLLGSRSPGTAGQLFPMAAILGLFCSGGIALARFAVRGRAQRGTPERALRLDRFATANGLRFTPGPVRSALLAPVAERGLLRVRSVVAGPGVEVGNVELRTADGRNRHTRFGGYCALRLPRPLPNLLLVATALRDHPLTDAAPPRGDQRLHLEGDFDRHFSLFCPAGYEADALFLMTPDIMARLIDTAGGWDVEIVDDLLVLSRPASRRYPTPPPGARSRRSSRRSSRRCSGGRGGGTGAPICVRSRPARGGPASRPPAHVFAPPASGCCSSGPRPRRS